MESLKSEYVIGRRVKILGVSKSITQGVPEKASVELPATVLLTDREATEVRKQTELYTPEEAEKAGLVPIERYHGGHIERPA